ILVLTADSDIQFVNQAAQQLLTNYQHAIGFSGDLIGQSLPAMMPSIQGLQSALAELHQPRSFRFSLPGFQGQLTATPVMTVDGERSGCVVEWQDNTEQLAIEQEIASLVSAAQQGDLSVRAKTAGRDGFLLGLSEGFNALLETWDDVLVDVNSALGQVAEGDLTPRLSQNYDGAYARLAANLNQALEKMGATLTQIDELADSISSGVRQINSGNQDLSQRTEQQANELQHIMQSLSEFSASMHTNAESTHASSNEAQATVSQASESQQTLSDAIAAMEQINQASSQISQIIGVIDEIAFQTNLLALNASVEAARAGESGRGFAVVATEVRNLAQRSATAASDIKSLILDSEQKVQAGTALVNHSGEALAAMVDRIGHLSEVSQALRTSIDTQLGALDKVQNGTQSIDNSTQQNASLAEQTSAASELLEARAKELFDSVRLFKVS
ncbi:MAG: methyl-accepting chemotaxis protein, partial [Litorivicinus sp.]